MATDIRASETFVMLADLLGRPMAGPCSFPTAREAVGALRPRH